MANSGENSYNPSPISRRFSVLVNQETLSPSLIHSSSWCFRHADGAQLRASGYARRRGFGFFLVLLATSMYVLLGKDNPVTTLSWSCLLSGFLVMVQSRKFVKKESVIIMPTFGIQLETQYISGKTVSRFIPIGKILKPVLVECVTPVTCYWSLSLFLRGEEQLTLVFKELRPLLKMLVPIWKALCAVTSTDQSEKAEEEHAVSG